MLQQCPEEKERKEIEQFLQKFDANGDGRISTGEIQDFLEKYGQWFAGFRAWRAMAANDFNNNGILDTPEEISAFKKYAKDQWKKTFALAIATPVRGLSVA